MPRIVRFHEVGEAEVLKIEEVEVPPVLKDEVRIQMKAIGLNRAEALFRKGEYIIQPEFPSRIGYEASGVVESVGSAVKNIYVGDAVSIIPPLEIGKYGVYGEIATVPVKFVVKHPSTISFIEAAAVWMQYMTAYGALIEIARIDKGDYVVITAASSSVGLAAIQICNMMGAVPIAITRKKDKREALLKAGASHIIVTDDEDIAQRLKEITANLGARVVGARVVFDPVGGKAVTSLMEGMSPHGTLFIYGSLSPDPTPFPSLIALKKSISMRGYILFELFEEDQKFERAKEFIINGLTSKKLAPIIAKTFPFEKIVEAHRYLESNQQLGKIVVTVD